MNRQFVLVLHGARMAFAQKVEQCSTLLLKVNDSLLGRDCMVHVHIAARL